MEPIKESTIVASIKNDNKFAALDEVLMLTKFYDTIDKYLTASGKSIEDFSIVIKPNFMFAYSKYDKTTFTDPELVEYLIEKIHERGFSNIAVVEAQSAYGNCYKNREVEKVALHVGYSKDKNYRIVDLTKEKVLYDFGGRLGRHPVEPTWRDADFRISFAKNKTHAFCHYTLCIKNIYGALTMQNKLKEYHKKREIYWPTIEMLKHFPVHFGLIDASISADGQFGIFADREPNITNTIIGGENIVAVDWVGARKMGLHPMVSRFMETAVEAFGMPEINWVGDKSEYKPWKNVEKVVIETFDLLEEPYVMTDWFFSILNEVHPYFKPKARTKLVIFFRKLTRPLRDLIFVRKPKYVDTEQIIASVKSDDKFSAFEEVLEKTSFFDDLNKNLKNSGKAKADFLIAIKPNFMVFHSSKDKSAHTDPELVEYLIDRMQERAFENIKVVESRNVLGKWYENRDVKTVAQVAGYSSKNYEIVDLTLEAIPFKFGGEFGEDFVGKTWMEADYRISFAKNKTHPANRYTLALKNIFGVTTSEDKYMEYHKKREWDVAVIEMYRAFPVHFGFIDAFISADQTFGFRGDKTAKETKTILGGKNIIALDWAGAMKMGLGPLESTLMKKAVKEWGKPKFQVYGNMDIYEDWDNTPFLLDKLGDILEECYTMYSFFTHAIMFEPNGIFREKGQGFFSRMRRLLGLD